MLTVLCIPKMKNIDRNFILRINHLREHKISIFIDLIVPNSWGLNLLSKIVRIQKYLVRNEYIYLIFDIFNI